MARHRKVIMTQLTRVVHLEYHQISRAKPMAQDAVEFTAFRRTYVSSWAGLSGVL